mmetsp:Transcript_2713/g.6067  ORF Transcript_2713/g.6067 Transcript_2713/m.6067 type:complete len:233 (-) Transcript_2713:252-950(-)
MSGVALPKKLYYFAIKGGLSAACCLLEMADADIEFKWCTTMDEWHAVRDEVPGRFPTGVLPAMELADGRVIPESGAIKRSIAAATGRLGEGVDYMVSEACIGLAEDFRKIVNENCPNVMNLGMMGAPKSFSDEDAKKCVEVTRPKVIKFINDRIAPMLAPEKDRFTKSGETVGEVDVFWALHQCEQPHPGNLGPLQAFYDRLRKNPGITRYIEGTGKYATPQLPMWQQVLPK